MMAIYLMQLYWKEHIVTVWYNIFIEKQPLTSYVVMGYGYFKPTFF